MVNTAEYKVRAAIRRILLSGSVGMLAAKGTSLATELPQPCIAGSCGSSVSGWVSSGSAQATQSGDTLTINQTTDRATLNWSSFNVSADGHVIFKQPSRSSIALNRIFQDSPSQILGRVDANGEIYLINPNGMVFGKTATVNAAGILASTLKLSDENFAAGIASPSILQGLRPALESSGPAALLSVEQGAQLATTGAGGRVLLAAQEINNAGSISAPDGQVILAAGDKVFLQASTDPSLRGLLVEVGESGVVTNAATGEISTPRGNTTLVGLAVNQQGRISATTTVAANGSIRLLARGAASAAVVSGTVTSDATRSGTLVFGAQSVTAVTPELSDTQTAVDDQAQLPSTIEGMGHQVLLQSGASIVANGGTLRLSAVADPRTTVSGDTPTLTPGFQDPDSQLLIQSGVHIDLSGSDATLPMSRNQLTVELRANELKDSPDQRDSAIRGQPLVVDARLGTTLGDVSGAIAAIPKTIAERTSKGGSAVLVSDGSVVVEKNAVLDVSGGQINYQSGYLQTSQLLGADGKLYDVATADPAGTYIAVINSTYRVVDDRWGRITQVPSVNAGQMQAAYVEGRSAGSLQFAAPSMVLNGTFLAQTVVGPYQRAANHVPAGGSFIVGLEKGFGLAPTLDYRAPDVTFVTATPNIAVASGASLPAWTPLSLPVDYLHNGFTRTVINSNGRISVATDAPLDLAPGSTFSLAGQDIAVDSSISNFGGSVTLATRDTIGLPGRALSLEQISIGRGVTIDVSGTWINDSPVVGAVANTPLFQDAGSITLKLGGTLAPATLQLGDDVSLLANGGAYYGDSVSGGRGGAISLLTTRPGALQDTTWILGSDIRLEGFGALNAAGGSIALDAPAIQLLQDSTWSRGQQLSAGDADDYLRLGTALFSDYGFSQFHLTASRPVPGTDARPVLEVLPGTTVQARVLSRNLSDAALLRASGGTLAGYTSNYLPLPDQRQAATVSLAAGLARGSSSNAGSLSVDAGAVLQGDAGSKFSFTSSGDILLSGIVRAAGGSVSANLLGPPSAANVTDTGYVAGRRIELAQTGVIDVSGAEIPVADDSGMLHGRVVQGGTVSLTADRGMIAIDAGSLIDVSGATALLDLPTGAQSQPYQRQQVGSAAGSLSVRTREGAYLLGDIRAKAGTDDSGTLAGGSLSVEVVRNPASVLPLTYPAGIATINVTQNDLPVVGSALAGYVGISRDQIVRAGFDAVTLRAFDSGSPDGGHIVLNAGLDLSLARQISLQAPVVALAGTGTVALHAPYVSIGDAVQATAPPSLAGGAVSLSVDAGNVDLYGATSVIGARQVSIGSSGDIRLLGAYLNDGTSSGSFTIAGDLTLAAARVYAATASQFTLAATGATDRISFVQRGVSPGVPLSAGSDIRVKAHEIDQGGTLLAPFGSITLQADSLNLLDGSLTSVSGKGSLIPYGYVLNGVWNFDYGRGVSPPELGRLPPRDISLNADAVTIAPSAKVDISGGGDLYAYEWIPGTGGTTDALAAGSRPGLYAVLPSLAGQIAPYDPREYVGSDLHPGDSIYLSGYANLAAGFYPLLPARYALLPGAYLVSVVPGSAEYLPGNPSVLRDGTPVIAGYRTFGNTGLGSGQQSGIAIRPGSFGRVLAEYSDYYASSYFPARALLLESGRATVPIDAGSLSIFAGRSLDVRGVVDTTAAKGGEGASISVSAENLVITNSTSQSAAGTVSIAASALDAWAPARLTLGGTRSDASDSTLTVTADHLTVESGVTLSAQDLLLAARQDIHVGAGATIATPSGLTASSAPPVLAAESGLDFADGDSAGAAILAMSDRNQVRVARNAVGAAGGTITLDQGSVIATRGALNLDAPAGVAAAGTLRVADAEVRLGANQISFADSAQAGTLTIDASLQDSLQHARSITLSGNQSIDFQRSTNLALAASSGTRLELQAPLLRGAGTAAVVLSADNVVLGGGSTANDGTPAGGSAALAVHAQKVEFDGGNLDLAGFSNTSITADSQVLTSATGLYRLGGDLQVHSPQIIVASGADTSFDVASGAVLLDRGNSPAAASTGLELGGALSIHAAQITDDALIQASSGSVSLQADSSLALLGNAVVDVAGRMVSVGDRQLGSSGGTVDLAAGTDLSTAGTSRIDLSAAGDSTAGTLAVTAGSLANLQGRLQATAASRAGGGEFDLSAGSLADFSLLNNQLEAGGFSRSRSVHVSSGDLNLAAGERISAQSVELVADSGQVRVDGIIDSTAADTKGAIWIEGGAGVSIGSAASLSTDSTGTANGGGDIVIGTQGGRIAVAAASQFSATGPGTSGNLVLRAPVAGNDVAIDALPSNLSRVAGVIVAPLFATDVSAAPTTVDLAAARQPATNFVSQNGAAVLARLNPGNLAVSLRPEVLLRRAGDLSLGAIDLSTWRFAGLPGLLSVVATGDIRTTGNISDGFTGSGNSLTLVSGESTSISLKAGRDLILGSSSAIRTGTGNLSLTAGRDLVFGDGATVYTGGIAGTAARTLPASTGTVNVVFPDRGGDLKLAAGRDVLGSPVAQSVTDWQFRGTRTAATQVMPRLWGILPSGFGWNVGSLGGGDVQVRAGRNVSDLSAAAADSELVNTDNSILHFGGGSLRISAGADIGSGQFFVGNGLVNLSAGGQIGSSRESPLGDALGSLLWMANTRATLTARDGVLIESVLNPTALLVPRAPNTGPRPSSFFSYSDDASLRVQSAAGDVVFHNNAERLQPFIETTVRQQSGDPEYFTIYPPQLDARSYSGDISFERVMYLFPAAPGQLSLFAHRDVLSGGSSSGGVIMSDGKASGISSVMSPSVGLAPLNELFKSASGSRHLGDAQSALVNAGRDIRDIAISVPTSVQLVAERDVRSIYLTSQNLDPDDVTLIQAGRDISASTNDTSAQIQTAGPGRLDILAGRNVDLGFSQGVVTTGALGNATLPFSTGADISVFAGLGRQPDFAAFIDKIIANSDQYLADVVAYMQQRDGVVRDAAAARIAFANLDATAQRPLITRLFFNELVQSGRAANLPGGNFQRGYTAIDALFPGSRGVGAGDPYDGDLNMSFSRIYTLAGGNISLLIPGGKLNVGLANPPPAFGQRAPSQLGIVAEGSGSVRVFTRDDVLVNQARIFTLLGGDIAIWSTLGNIDAGRGAKSSLSAPPPTVIIDDSGKVTIDFSAAVAGSGIRTVITGEGVTPGNVDLIAPAGFVNAGDAGIGAAGNLNIAAQTVVGLDNIQVGGASTGVPAEAGGVGAELSGATSAASSATAAGKADVAGSANPEPAPMAQTALSWLDVFLEGFGEEACKSNDAECLQRNRSR